MNIFTHLIPGLVAIAIGLSGYEHWFDATYPAAGHLDKIMFGGYFVAATACMLLSAGFHTLMSHHDLFAMSLKMDYCGIITLALGDFISGIYVSFYCEPSLQKAYWAMVSLQNIATESDE